MNELLMIDRGTVRNI